MYASEIFTEAFDDTNAFHLKLKSWEINAELWFNPCGKIDIIKLTWDFNLSPN